MGSQCFSLIKYVNYTLCIEILITDHQLSHKSGISIDKATSKGLTIGNVVVKKFSHRYIDSSKSTEFMYCQKVIVNFRKTVPDPPYQLYLLIDIRQDGDNGDNFHTLYKPDVSTAMTMNIPLDMNGKRIINSPSIKRPIFSLPGMYLKANDGKYVFLWGTDVIITPAACKLVKLYYYTAELEFEHNLWFFINSLNITTQHSRSYSYAGNKLTYQVLSPI